MDTVPLILIAADAAGGILLIFVGLAGRSQVDPVPARLTQLGAAQARNLEELELQAPLMDRTIRPLIGRASGVAQAVTSQFGDAFSRAVFGLDAGPWHGPVASAYGFHLVRVNARQDAQPLPYEAARAQVLEDWQREEQTQASQRFYAELLKKYDVVVDDSVKPLVGPLAGMAR